MLTLWVGHSIMFGPPSQKCKKSKRGHKGTKKPNYVPEPQPITRSIS
jgi:hypothetical protein